MLSDSLLGFIIALLLASILHTSAVVILLITKRTINYRRLLDFILACLIASLLFALAAFILLAVNA